MSLLAVVISSVLYVASAECPMDYCGKDQTCCDGLKPLTYGCCPKDNAVCCSDGLHCCPENTVCNLSEGTCDKVNGLIPFLIRDPPVPVFKLQASTAQKANDLGRNYCPGRQGYCEDDSNCCPKPSGEYVCCPFPYPNCCPDGEHCCEFGTTCDSTSSHCLYPSLIKTPAVIKAH